MSTNAFEFVGKLKAIADKDTFHPYEKKGFTSGWQTETLKFNIICGTNRHMLTLQAGAWADKSGNIDEKKTVLYSFKKTEDGGKAEQVKVAFADRSNPDILAETPEWKKYIVDLEVPGRRYDLEKAVKAFADGNITDEICAKAGVTTEEEAKDALAKSQARRKEYLFAGDMIEYLRKVLASEKMKDKKFKVRGNIEYQYSDSKDVFYVSYVPQRVYIAADADEDKSEGTFDAFFNKEGFDDTVFDETGKYYFNAYSRVYDGRYKNDACKGNIAVPLQFVIDGADEKKAKVLRKRLTAFDGDAEYREIGLTVSIVDGADIKEITLEDLDEDTRDNIDAGLVTLEEVQRELGGGKAGDRVVENRIVGLSRGFTSGSKESVYTDADFEKPHHDVADETPTAAPATKTASVVDDDEDIL